MFALVHKTCTCIQKPYGSTNPDSLWSRFIGTDASERFENYTTLRKYYTHRAAFIDSRETVQTWKNGKIIKTKFEGNELSGTKEHVRQ